jgi:hypothetical protein
LRRVLALKNKKKMRDQVTKIGVFAAIIDEIERILDYDLEF